MINFLVLILILNKLLYKPILGIIDRRKKIMEDSDTEVKGLQETAARKMAEYEERLRQAKLAAVDQRNEIVKAGSEQAKKIIDAVRKEIPGILAEFHGKMDREIEGANRILRENSRKLSLEIAEKVMGRSIS
jgi:F-type H+-transporting ATPase subunit b